MRGKIDLDEAVRTLNKHNGLCTDGAINTYRKLVIKILLRNNNEENEEHIITISLLRDILYRLANQYRSLPSIEKSSIFNISELLMVIHYQNMLYMTRSMGLKDITAKCAITLLKYPELIPSDKAFYQAGMACRDQGNINLSFLLLNR
jgi:intraflagellar transport protein 172